MIATVQKYSESTCSKICLNIWNSFLLYSQHGQRYNSIDLNCRWLPFFLGFWIPYVTIEKLVPFSLFIQYMPRIKHKKIILLKKCYANQLSVCISGHSIILYCLNAKFLKEKTFSSSTYYQVDVKNLDWNGLM